jgi:hypothetical protein
MRKNDEAVTTEFAPLSLSDLSALIALGALGLFVFSMLLKAMERGFFGALDFKKIGLLTVISMLIGLVAFALGVISLFPRSRNKHAAVGIIIGALVASFPIALFLLWTHLGYYYVAPIKP